MYISDMDITKTFSAITFNRACFCDRLKNSYRYNASWRENAYYAWYCNNRNYRDILIERLRCLVVKRCSISFSFLPQNTRIFTRIALVNKTNDILWRDGAPRIARPHCKIIFAGMTLGETRLLYHEIIVIAFYASVIASEIFRENKGRGREDRFHLLVLNIIL